MFSKASTSLDSFKINHFKECSDDHRGSQRVKFAMLHSWVSSKNEILFLLK